MRGTFVAVGIAPQRHLNLRYMSSSSRSRSVGVEARARPSCPSAPVGDHRRDARGHLGADRARRSRPRRRARRSRAARAAPSGGRRPAHAVVDRLAARGRVSSSSATASKRNGNSRRLTTKPGVSGTSTAVLPSAAQSARARSRVSSSAAGGKTSSTRSIFGTGLKTCRPTKRSGRPGRLRRASATDSARGRRGQDRAVRRGARRARAAARPWRRLLGDRLDDEGGVAQRLEVVGYGHVARADAAAPLDQLLHLRGRGVRAARPQHDLAVLGRDARKPGGDGAAAGDPDPF